MLSLAIQKSKKYIDLIPIKDWYNMASKILIKLNEKNL